MSIYKTGLELALNGILFIRSHYVALAVLELTENAITVFLGDDAKEVCIHQS